MRALYQAHVLFLFCFLDKSGELFSPKIMTWHIYSQQWLDCWQTDCSMDKHTYFGFSSGRWHLNEIQSFRGQIAMCCICCYFYLARFINVRFLDRMLDKSWWIHRCSHQACTSQVNLFVAKDSYVFWFWRTPKLFPHLRIEFGCIAFPVSRPISPGLRNSLKNASESSFNERESSWYEG